MVKMVLCIKCVYGFKTQLGVECRKESAKLSPINGSSTWPLSKIVTDGCFSGKETSNKLSDMINEYKEVEV